MKKLILSICMFLAVMACGEAEKESQNIDTKPMVKIGALYPMSGEGAVYGEAAKATVEMFFEEFNKDNPKFDYQVVFEDNQLDLAKTAMLAQKLINVDKVDVLFSVMSNFGAVVSPIAEQKKVLHLSVATDPSVAKGDYNFMASSNVMGEADLFYNQLVKNGAKKVDAVIVNATGPQTMFDYFKQKNARENKLKIDNIYSVNGNEKDFRLMLAKIKENKPDYIVVLLAMPAIDIFMRQYHEAAIDIPVSGIETFSYLQNKSLVEGMWYVDAATATDDFIKKYEQKTQSTVTHYAEYMDFMLQMITTGYEGTQNTDKLKVADFIQNNMEGVKTAVGVVSVESDGIVNGQPLLKRIINGKPVIVEE